MKILYVKFNSERNPEFALKTTIYQHEDQKFVSKSALNPKAKKHIQRITSGYELLSELSIQKIHPLKYLNADDKTITFEFIKGVSLEEEFLKVKHDPRLLKEFWLRFETLIKNSFKTTTFDSSKMVSKQTQELFGYIDYSLLDGMECFDGATNLDLIFSNLIQTDDTIQIIDYEWTFPVNVPVDYILFRTKLHYEERFHISFGITLKNEQLFWMMERHFIDKFVMKEGFYFYKYNYLKINTPLDEYVRIKEEEISHLKVRNEFLENIRTKCYPLLVVNKVLKKTIQFSKRVLRVLKKMKDFDYAKFVAKRIINKAFPKFFIKYKYKQPQLTPQIEQEIQSFQKKPLISILIPVYNVDPKWLQKAIESVQKQWYTNWEICIVDDKSTNKETLQYLRSLNNDKIKIKYSTTNKNIAGASNEAVNMANGEYLALLDNDDELTHDALYEVVKKINETGAEFIYSDEDFIDPEGKFCNPHFKPDFSPDLLLSHNYITHFSCFTKELFKKAGSFDTRFSGSQDYDLFLRMSDKTDKIEHVQKVLYHWRMIEGSTSADSKAKPEALEISKQVLEETLRRRGIEGWVEHGNIDHYFRVRYVIKNDPLVSIIIPFKDKPELLSMCIRSIIEKSTYTNYEIIGISNNSQEETTFTQMQQLQALDSRVKFYEYNTPFNYANINNYAVETYAKGEHILLLNNDIEVISPDWIEAMLEHSQREEIGCVGAKLYYPNETVQHAGIIIGLGGYAGHSHKLTPREEQGYFNRLNAVQNLSAVTAACLMVKKSIYNEVNGMDEINFKVAYNDVDFCLRIREKGYLNLFTPYAELYHHESLSRGYETTPEKIARFNKEKEALYKRHKEILENGDPYYNPNLTHSKEDFTVCL